MTRTALLEVLIGFVALSALRCGAATDLSDTPSRITVTVISGGVTQDSALARPPEPMVLELVNYRGQLVSKGTLRITADGLITFSLEPDGPFTDDLEVADHGGRIAVYCRFGSEARSGSLLMEMDDPAAKSLTSVTVTPGAPDSIAILPRQGLAMVGTNDRAVTATVYDQSGNWRQDTVTFTSDTTGLTIDADGLVTARASGRWPIEVRVASVVETIWFGVVPRGLIVAGGRSIVTFTPEGDDRRTIVSDLSWSPVHAPTWFPDGCRILFQDDGSRLSIVDIAGTVSPILEGAIPVIGNRAEVTRDGEWIYYAERSGFSRIRADGADREFVGPDFDGLYLDEDPSPSADGTRIAFHRHYNGRSGPYVVRVYDIGRDSVFAFDWPGKTPRWSPVSDVVAVVDSGVIRTYDLRSTTMRTVSQTDALYSTDIAWSPDGRWIVGQHKGMLEIIHVESRARWTISGTDGLRHPSWGNECSGSLGSRGPTEAPLRDDTIER